MRCDKNSHRAPESTELKLRTEFYAGKKCMQLPFSPSQRGCGQMHTKPRATKWLVATAKIYGVSVACRDLYSASDAYHAKTGFARHFVSASSRTNLQKCKK